MARRRGPKFARVVTDDRQRHPSDRVLWKQCKAAVNARWPADPLATRIGRTIGAYETMGGTWEDGDGPQHTQAADEHGVPVQ